MAEEDVKTEDVKTDDTDESADPIETIAQEIGWNPDYDGEGSKSAAEYIRNGRAIQETNSKHMKRQKRQIDDMTRGIEDLKTFQETNYKVQVTALKGKVSQLEVQLTEAREDEDRTAEKRIETEIKKIRDIPDELPKIEKPGLHPDFVSWNDKNEWYDNDDELRSFADALGQTPEYQALAGVDLKRCLKNIEGAAKKEFPDKFKKQPSAPSAPSVEGSGRRNTAKIKNTYRDLTRAQQDTCDNFVSLGIMSRAEYIKDLEANNEVS